MRERRLVGAGADAVTDRVAGLAGVADFRKPVADQDVELAETRSRANVLDGGAVDAEQAVEQLVVFATQRARAGVLGQI